MKSSSTIFLLTLSALLISSGTVVSIASGNSSFQTSLSGYYPMITHIIHIHTMVTRTIPIHIILPLERML
jgi:hypothetical protein